MLNGRMVMTKSLTTRTSNRMLRLRVKKLEQRESLLVYITGNPSVTSRTSDILELTIGATTNLTIKVVVCVLNLL